MKAKTIRLSKIKIKPEMTATSPTCGQNIKLQKNQVKLQNKKEKNENDNF